MPIIAAPKNMIGVDQSIKLHVIVADEYPADSWVTPLDHLTFPDVRSYRCEDTVRAQHDMYAQCGMYI